MKRWIDYLIIMLVGVVTHGLLLFNDGIYWDGWLLYSRLVKRESLVSWLVEAGRPIEFCFHWVMGHLPGLVFEYKLVAFLSIIISAVLIYKICGQTKLLNRGESLLVAVIFLTFPVFHVGVEMTIIPYLFLYLLYWLAVFLTFKSEESTGPAGYAWRVLSLLIFFVSFSLYSLLVFFFGFILVLVLHVRYYRGYSWRQIVTRFLPGHLDYIIMPFLFWILSQRFFGLSDFYAKASDKLVKFDWVPIKDCFSGFVHYVFYDQWIAAAGNLRALPLFSLLVLLVAYWSYKAYRVTILRWLGIGGRPWYFIIIGAVLFLAGTFPYTAVGAYPRMYSWDTRNAILAGLPIALIVVGLFRLVFSSKLKVLNHLAFMTLVMIISAFILSNINAYLYWQSVWIKNRSIIYNLSQKKMCPAYFCFLDRSKNQAAGGRSWSFLCLEFNIYHCLGKWSTHRFPWTFPGLAG